RHRACADNRRRERRGAARGQGTRDVSDPRHREVALRRARDRGRTVAGARMSIEAHGPTLPAAPADASPFWTLSRVADALSARARGPLPRGDHRLARVWTDTRSLRS